VKKYFSKKSMKNEQNLSCEKSFFEKTHEKREKFIMRKKQFCKSA